VNIDPLATLILTSSEEGRMKLERVLGRDGGARRSARRLEVVLLLFPFRQRNLL
jgi:hypothetical protein